MTVTTSRFLRTEFSKAHLEVFRKYGALRLDENHMPLPFPPHGSLPLRQPLHVFRVTYNKTHAIVTHSV